MRRQGRLIRDDEGDDLSDLEAVQTLDFDTLCDMQRLSHVYGPPREWKRNVFVIADESGSVLAEIPYDTLL